MASLYQRKNSPFYWVKYKDPETGEIRRMSTGMRVGLGTERRKALQQRDALAIKETKFTPANKHERFERWANDFIGLRYRDLTLSRVLTGWRRILAFLQEQRITHPAQFQRRHALAYITWRTTPGEGRVAVHKNTALTELAYASSVFSEAVNRGYILTNPCARLGVKGDRPKPKAEITDAEIAKIRLEIDRVDANEKIQKAFLKIRNIQWDVKRFLHVSFEIALHQGCRLSETYLDIFRDVNLEKQEISFHAKGDKFYTTALNPGLNELFKHLRALGGKMSYDFPPEIGWLRWRTLSSFYWGIFFRMIGLKHLSFHCTRVTCISRLERGGCPEHLTMRMVNHSSTTVHRIYRRVSEGEVHSFWPAFSCKPSESGNPDSLPTNPEQPDRSSDSHG